MSINLTDEIEVKTKKGKLGAAKQIFLDGDQENLQQIGEKTHQLEDAIKDITVSGGASTANAVSYSNETSGMTAVTAQGAIDELAAKTKTQDATIGTKAEKADVQSSVSELKAKNTLQDVEIAKKANSADVTSQMQTEQSRINAELGKKFDKKSILQESGEAEDKVMSQKAVSTKLSDLSTEKADRDLVSLNSSLLKYAGSKISLIGDSISTFRGYIPEGYASHYPKGAVDSVDKTYWNILCRSLNATIQNLSYAGTCVTNQVLPEYSLNKRVSLVDEESSLIIIALGINDNKKEDNVGAYDYDKDIYSYNEGIFTEAYIKAIRTLITLYPSADLLLVAMGPDGSMPNRASAIKNIAEHYGLMFFDARPYYSGNIHPDTDTTDNGNEMMAIAKGLLDCIGNNVNFGLYSTLRVTSNKEFLFVFLDRKRRVAFGVKRNGEFYIGEEVPSKIKRYILEKCEDLKKYINSKIGESETSILNTVDVKYKDINNAVKFNPSDEYSLVVTDIFNKLLLSITKRDAFLNAQGIRLHKAELRVVSNNEFLFALTDCKNKCLLGIKRNGKSYLGGELLINTEYIDNVIANVKREIADAKTALKADIEDNVKEISEIKEIYDVKYISKHTISDFADFQFNFGYLAIGQLCDFNKAVGSLASYKHLVLNVEDSEFILLTTAGGNAPRAYGFFDSDKKLLSKSDPMVILNNETITVPKNASYLVVNLDTSKVSQPIVVIQKNNVHNELANINEKINHTFEISSADLQIKSYINGLKFSKDLNNHIADLKKDGDKMVHVSTFCIINDVLYATYYVNTIHDTETPTEHTERFVICPMSTISDPSTYEYHDLCYTKAVAENDSKEEILINNHHIEQLYDIVLLRKDETTLYLAWTCTLDGVYFRVYKTYNINTKEFSDISINKFKVKDTICDFSILGMINAFNEHHISYKFLSGDIGIMQKLSTHVEDGQTYYYTGAYCGEFNCIIKSKDLITWDYVSTPSFPNKSMWENATYVKGDKVFYFCRQHDTPYAFLTYFDLNLKTWHYPIYVQDTQSRYDFIEYNYNLYLVHSPIDRGHLSIMKINTSNLGYSYDVQTAEVGDAFYPFMEKYKNELYMSFTSGRKHIYLSKFTIEPFNSYTISEKFKELFNI